MKLYESLEHIQQKSYSTKRRIVQVFAVFTALVLGAVWLSAAKDHFKKAGSVVAVSTKESTDKKADTDNKFSFEPLASLGRGLALAAGDVRKAVFEILSKSDEIISTGSVEGLNEERPVYKLPRSD